MTEIYAGFDCPCGHPMAIEHELYVCAVYGRRHRVIDPHPPKPDCRTKRRRKRKEAV